MRVRHLAGFALAGLVIAAGCGDSGDDSGGNAGSAGAAASGSGGSAADAGSVGGSAGTATGGGAGAGTGGSGATGGTDGGAGSGGSGGCVPATCQGKLYQCGDCIDNDGDGKVDVGEDPDCLGPCHNAEDTFFGSIPGQAGPACTVDCYFDQDSGAGNDGCYWNHKCDPLSLSPKYPPEGDSACECTPGSGSPWPCTANTPGTSGTCKELYDKQSSACESFCGPLTPNGCDCFGCCELPAHSGKFVWLGSEDSAGNGICDLASVGDPDKCRPCTPVAGCLNGCETCELCLGKTELPPECLPPDGGAGTGGSSGSGGTGGSGGSCGGQICPAGSQPCGLDCQDPCPQGQFCLTGCCTFVP